MEKTEFITRLKILIDQLDFDDEAKREALRYIEAHYRFLMAAQAKVYSSDNDTDKEHILRYRPRTRLMILICKMVFLEEVYQAKGLPVDVMLDTLSDLTLRQTLFIAWTGRLGLNEDFQARRPAVRKSQDGIPALEGSGI